MQRVNTKFSVMVQVLYYQSPMGWFEIQGSHEGISSVRLTAQPGENSLGVNDLLVDTARQLDEYFHRERETFDVLLDWSGSTAFKQLVWMELLRIPYGETTTYSAIAKKIDNPNAIRAVGLANRTNPIAIIVPCHRVIARSGELQGYFYGLDMKRKLLELENPDRRSIQSTLF